MKLFGYTHIPRRQFLKILALVSAFIVGLSAWSHLFGGKRRVNTRGMREAKYYRSIKN